MDSEDEHGGSPLQVLLEPVCLFLVRFLEDKQKYNSPLRFLGNTLFVVMWILLSKLVI